jgi:hypothetical protein
MKNCISVLAITFVLISCGHGTTQHFPKGKGLTNPAEIVIVRNKNFLCGGQSTTIFLDGMEIAQLRTGEYVSFPVEPGVHHIRAVPFLGSGRLFSDNFEEGKKHYLLISLFDMGDYSFAENLASAITRSGHGCDFEIEKISEENGLKRIKSSKNLVEKKEAPKSLSKATPTKSGPKKVPVTFDPEEPWTGKWRVEGHITLKGIWAMKQSGTIVKSTKESYYEFKGKVRGNQLEGKLTGDYNQTQNIVITLSADGQSFKGFTRGAVSHQSGPIKGKRE